MQGKLSGAERLLHAQAEFSALVDFVQEDRESEEISQVEKQLFSRLLDLGRSLLGVYVSEKGPGYVGPVLEREDGSRWVCHLPAAGRKEMRKIIGYFEQNRAPMDYARYRREGYPIGSGVVEAAGKTLVKNRREQTGMRWKEEGAEALLKLRAVFLNGSWEEFWRFYLQRQAA